jgi:hypothetical protein
MVLRRLKNDRRVPRASLLQGERAPHRRPAPIGRRQTGQYGMVVPCFVPLAPTGKPIHVYGDGTQCRSFTWVGDVARGSNVARSSSGEGRRGAVGQCRRAFLLLSEERSRGELATQDTSQRVNLVKRLIQATLNRFGYQVVRVLARGSCPA